MSHSLSPRLHNAAFAALGLDYVYVPLPVRGEDVGAAVLGLAALGFRGANVTIPHKAAVIPFLDEISEDARLADAVNTITVEGGHLHGYNTDVEGVRGALVAAAGDTFAGEPALVTAGVPGARCGWLALSDLTAGDVRRQTVVVNATSLGMAGEGKVPALLADNVTAGQVVFDAVYASVLTDFLVTAQAAGAIVVDGLTMLLGQAAEAFSLWTGVPAPLEVMRDAVRR